MITNDSLILLMIFKYTGIFFPKGKKNLIREDYLFLSLFLENEIAINV